MLPDIVLLEIFDVCRNVHDYTFLPVWEWHILVHVCQRWRQIVFASPNRLSLRLLCRASTPARKNIDIWPALPIFIDFNYHFFFNSRWWHDKASYYVDNVISALEHLDRVCDIRLSVTGSELDKIITVMQEPFPALMNLIIDRSRPKDGIIPILPANFLGGSAPCLQEMHLCGIPFPALPTLLSSTDLVTLELYNIPPTGYFSPEALVRGLSALPRLKTFDIEFKLATPLPDRIHPPPVTRTVLPALTFFRFVGASEYLEDLVARIDGPRLNWINIHYLNQLVDFQVAQLPNFIDRSVGPKSNLFKTARVTFYSDQVTVSAYRHASYPLKPAWHPATTSILCEGIDWQVSHMAQVLSHFSATLSDVAHLELHARLEEGCQSEDTDVEWVHLLHQFSNIRTLRVYGDIAGQVARALEDIAEEMMIAEVLPSLGLIYLEGQPASTIGKFVAARRLSDLPVTVVDTEEEFKSYASE